MAMLSSVINRQHVLRMCLILISIPLTGCIFDGRSMRIDGPYILGWIDTSDTTDISYDLGDGASIGRIPERVIAYGANEKYITAEREHHGYYYIDREKDHKYAEPVDVVFGPFEKSHFESLSLELGLPPLRDVPRSF